MGFEEYVNKGIFLRLKSGKTIVGLLTEYDAPVLFISSRGNKYTVNKEDIGEIRESLDEVEP